MINTGEGPDFSDDTRLNETIDFYKRWNGVNGRITELLPHAIYTCSPAYIRARAETAQSTEHHPCIWMKPWLSMKIV